MSISVKARLVSLGALGVAITLVTGAAGWWGLARSSEGLAEVTVSAVVLQNHMEADMMHDALRADVLAALLATTPEEHDAVKADVKDHAETFRAAVASNEAAGASQGVMSALKDVAEPLAAYIASAERLVDTARTDREAARAAMPEFIKSFEHLEGAMASVSEVIEKDALGSKEHASSLQSQAKVGIFIAVGSASLLLLAGAAWIIRGIIRPLSATMHVLEQASKGDLRVRADGSQADEFGALARSCNLMFESMAAVVRSAAASSTQVVAAADDISRAGEESAAGLTQQAGEVEGLLASLQEMSATISDVAQKCAGAATAAQSSEQAAGQGGEAIRQSVEGMARIKESVTQGAATVAGLGQRSEEIGRIIGVINDIADQTNLLALNAAIEAARAGEHGRGFAVVADEVRKLAERTTKATEEVAQSIRTIQDETGRAVKQIDAGVSSVADGSSRAERAGQELVTIVSSVKDVAAMIRTIAAAAEEQSAAAGKITGTMEAIRGRSQSVASEAQRTRDTAGELAAKSREVAGLVGRFTV